MKQGEPIYARRPNHFSSSVRAGPISPQNGPFYFLITTFWIRTERIAILLSTAEILFTPFLTAWLKSYIRLSHKKVTARIAK